MGDKLTGLNLPQLRHHFDQVLYRYMIRQAAALSIYMCSLPGGHLL